MKRPARGTTEAAAAAAAARADGHGLEPLPSCKGTIAARTAPATPMPCEPGGCYIRC